MNISITSNHNNTNGKSFRPIVINNVYTSLEKKVIEFAFNQLHKINPNNKSRHVTTLLKGRNIVGYGINNEKSSYTNFFGYLSNHSEYDAVRKYLRFHTTTELSKLSMYNCRINRFNEVVLSRPCRRCQSLLEFFPVKSVFFTGESGRFEQWLN